MEASSKRDVKDLTCQIWDGFGRQNFISLCAVPNRHGSFEKDAEKKAGTGPAASLL